MGEEKEDRKVIRHQFAFLFFPSAIVVAFDIVFFRLQF
jgi:hypothetical protein